MTTIAVDLDAMMIAADSQNTDPSGAKWLCEKIEVLSDGSIFLGSGHNYTIHTTKLWALKGFAEKDRPEYGVLFCDDAKDYGFTCLVIRSNGDVYMVDDERAPIKVFDRKIAIGAGAAYALGAMDAGANVQRAVEIACERDINSCPPIHVQKIPPFKSAKRR